MSLRCEFFSCPTIRTWLHPKATAVIIIALTLAIFWMLHITKYSLGEQSYCSSLDKPLLSADIVLDDKLNERDDEKLCMCGFSTHSNKRISSSIFHFSFVLACQRHIVFKNGHSEGMGRQKNSCILPLQN